MLVTCDRYICEVVHVDALPKQKHLLHPPGLDCSRLKVPDLQVSQAGPWTFSLQKQCAVSWSQISSAEPRTSQSHSWQCGNAQ